jgi:hypothetical protein
MFKEYRKEDKDDGDDDLSKKAVNYVLARVFGQKEKNPSNWMKMWNKMNLLQLRRLQRLILVWSQQTDQR